MTAFLTIERASAGYGPTEVLAGIDMQVAKGERVAILGRNGAGKSTLLKTIMGLARQLSGAVALEGQDISAMSPDQRAHAGIGYVPQTRNIFKSLSVEENLLTGLKGRPRSALEESYAAFPRLYERRKSGGHDLSGGEQQMLAIARTLLGRPTLLLLDEPLEGLAPLVCKQLMKSFAEFADTMNMSILLVEQKVGDALAFAERAIVLENGAIALSDTTANLRADQKVLDRYISIA